MDSSRKILLAENLKRYLSEKQTTVSVVAKQIGMNKSTLHGYCNGIVPRNLMTICELADFLDVSLSELVFGKSSEPEDEVRAAENFEGHFEIVVRRIPSRRVKNDPRER